jgi:hypothetical protein
MSLPLKQKIGFTVGGITLLYMLSDILFELLFEGLDLAFEGIEYAFDAIIEHLFDTSRHTAQIFTFYLLFLIAALLLYRLSRHLPGWYGAAKADWIHTCHQLNTTTVEYWHATSVIERVKWGSAIVIGGIMLMWGLLI